MVVTDLELNSLLLRAVELGATDVHLKLGQMPALRRDGQLELLEGASPLSEADRVALGSRLALGGCRYRGTVIRRAASSHRSIRRRLAPAGA